MVGVTAVPTGVVVEHASGAEIGVTGFDGSD
jgi:hypothetical protein